MQHYLECLQIGTLTLIALFICAVLLGLLVVIVCANFKRVLVWLGIAVGVVTVAGIAEALGMVVKAIFKI